MMKTISASISPAALQKASRFFDLTLDDIMIEQLQNARRAKATHIKIFETATCVSIVDNGEGISDPSTLLCFGESGWDENLTQLEDAAGMGFWALSPLGCHVRSVAKGNNVGWEATFDKKVFVGKKPALIEPIENSYSGTSITFNKPDGNNQSIEYVLERIAEYYPVPIDLFYDQRWVKKFTGKDFLEDTVCKKVFDDVTIGVTTKTSLGMKPTINFHGLTIRENPAKIEQVQNYPSYETLFDFKTADRIKLVLPARKQVMKNSKWDECIALAYTAIFEHIKSEEAHTLSYKDYQYAHKLGIDLPEAKPLMRPWGPTCADSYLDPYLGHNVTTPCKDDYLLWTSMEPRDEQHLHQALDNSRTKIRLFPEYKNYEGYSWYDGLPRIIGIKYIAEKSGDKLTFDSDCNLDLMEGRLNDGDVETLGAGIVAQFEKPDSIYAELTIEDGDMLYHRQLPMDFLMIGEGYSPEEVTVLIEADACRDKKIEPQSLADQLTYAFFCADDSSESDRYETQLKNYEIAAYAYALQTLCSQEEGDIAFVKEHVIEHILWRCPSNRKTTIEIEKGQINVAFTDIEPANVAGNDQ